MPKAALYTWYILPRGRTNDVIAREFAESGAEECKNILCADNTRRDFWKVTYEQYRTLQKARPRLPFKTYRSLPDTAVTLFERKAKKKKSHTV